MKKMAIAGLLLCFLLFILSCEPTLPADIVSFRINGKLIELTGGLYAYNGAPSLLISSTKSSAPAGSYTILATDISCAVEAESNYYVQIYGTISSGNTATFNMVFLDTYSARMLIGNVSIIIDTTGSPGDYFSGSFSGTLSYAPDTFTITDGFFNVRRVDPGIDPYPTAEPTSDPTG